MEFSGIQNFTRERKKVINSSLESYWPLIKVLHFCQVMSWLFPSSLLTRYLCRLSKIIKTEIAFPRSFTIHEKIAQNKLTFSRATLDKVPTKERNVKASCPNSISLSITNNTTITECTRLYILVTARELLCRLIFWIRFRGPKHQTNGEPQVMSKECSHMYNICAGCWETKRVSGKKSLLELNRAFVALLS